MRTLLVPLSQSVLILSLAALPGCGDKPTPATTPSSATPPGSTPSPPVVPATVPTNTEGADLLNANPDVSLTPKEMSDSANDRSSFANKYGKKIIDVKGLVTRHNETQVLFLDGAGFYLFNCQDKYAVSKAMPGQTATLRGRLDTSGYVYSWTIVQVEGAPPPTLTAEQLAKDYLDDKDGVETKYKGKYLVITGTIYTIEKDVGTNLHLTPPGQTPEVTCFFGVTEANAAEKAGLLKVGQPVRALGRWKLLGPGIDTCVALPLTKQP